MQRLLLVIAGALASGGLLDATTVYGASSAASGTPSLYTVNPATGGLSLIGAFGTEMYDIAWSDSLGMMYGISGASGTSSLYTVNRSTGAATVVGSSGAFLNGLVFGNGTLYASGNHTFYTVNRATGLATTVGSGTYTSSGDLEFDGSGNLYLTSTTGGNDSLYRINTATGAGTLIGSAGSLGFPNVWGLAWANGTMYGFTAGGNVITINLATGAGTAVTTYASSFNGIAVANPEPATLIMMGSALVGFGLLRQAKR
jgi:hypothetical protein